MLNLKLANFCFSCPIMFIYVCKVFYCERFEKVFMKMADLHSI